VRWPDLQRRPLVALIVGVDVGVGAAILLLARRVRGLLLGSATLGIVVVGEPNFSPGST
jgi:hypothetical protein